MFSLMHITDLHRAKSDPISNAELVSALVSDRDRYLHEDPPISQPQAIVVSGDVIQGVGLGTVDSSVELRTQYETAYDFLAEITDRFLAGDRTKLVIIPGNHDIDWNRAYSAMEKVHEEDIPHDFPNVLHEPNSRYRWDWKKRQIFIIKNNETYLQRFEEFWKFFEKFYGSFDGMLRVNTWSDANLYSLDEGRIGLAAFNSCSGNDCFAFHGEIPREVVARSHLDLQALGPWRLRIAVWHHDIEGPPNRYDYMDPEIVRGMIGRGFRLGLYGHQHRPQITPQHAYLPDLETMAITSAGSLCAGARELPTGARRGYSIIEVGDNYDCARVHVREMAFANLFSRANLAAFGGRSYVDLKWTTPADSVGRPEDPVGRLRAAVLQQAEAALLQQKNPAEALRLLATIDGCSDEFGRRLALSATQALNDPDRIIEFVREPRSIEEVVFVIDAHLAKSQYDAATSFLNIHGHKFDIPTSLREDLSKKITLSRRAKS